MGKVPRLAVALSGLVLAAVAAVLVFWGQPGAEPPDSSINPASLAPSSTGIPPELLAAPWFAQTFDFASDSELRGYRLSVGLLDGTVTRDVNVGLATRNPPSQWSGALPFAAGPFDGQVLYGYFDGTTSKLRVVSAADGDDRLILETDEVVHQAVLDPVTGALYYLALDPVSRRELGIFSGRIQSREAEQLVPPRFSPDATQIASRLFLTPGGSRLVSHDCRDDECRLRAYAAANGDPIFDVAAPASDVFGITDSEVILSGASVSVGEGCPQAPCPAIAFDLESGQRHPLGNVCGAAMVVGGPAGPVLVSDGAQPGQCAPGPVPIAATDIRTGDEVAEFPVQDLRGLVVTTRDQAVGLPEGWLLLGSAGQFYALEPAADQNALTLVRIDGGMTLELPGVSLPHR